jgi:translation initiation factor 4G
MPLAGLPISPRNPPSSLQGPSTPTLSHTIASPVHPPPHPSALAHSSNSTPSTLGDWLGVSSRTFAKRAAATKLTIKKVDGTEVSLENVTKRNPAPPTPAVSSPHSVVLRQGSPRTPYLRPTRVYIDTEDQRESRLAEQEQNDRLKAEAADKGKKEKEKAEAEQQKELRRKQEERLRKDANKALERQRLKELKLEKERILKAKQEKALRLAQERAKEKKERKDKEEQEERERLSKLAEETRLRLKVEAAAKVKAEAIFEPEREEREEAELDSEEAHKGDGKR